MLSLPIPSAHDAQFLGDIRHESADVATLAADLTDNRINQETRVHLDPDLYTSALARSPGWKPAFGQIAAAQSHLAKQGVGAGDIFLFFGWFRRVEKYRLRWRYVPGSPNFHAIFGWLQIGEVLAVGDRCSEIAHSYPWLRTHPHVAGATRFVSRNNTIYIGSETLALGGRRTRIAGAGRFGNFSHRLQLSAEGKTRSLWRLPAWFLPSGRESSLTYHGNPSRWSPQGDSVLLQTVAKGQEFVLDSEHYPESVEWLASLFAQCPTDE